MGSCSLQYLFLQQQHFTAVFSRVPIQQTLFKRSSLLFILSYKELCWIFLYFYLGDICLTKSSAGRPIISSLYRGNTGSCGARWVLMRIHLDFALICSLLSFVFVKVGTYANTFRFCFDLLSREWLSFHPWGGPNEARWWW